MQKGKVSKADIHFFLNLWLGLKQSYIEQNFIPYTRINIVGKYCKKEKVDNKKGFCENHGDSVC